MKKVLFTAIAILGVVNFVNAQTDSKLQIIHQTPNQTQSTWDFTVLSNGGIVYQSNQYNYIKDKKYNQTFESLDEFEKMINDMVIVKKTKESIKTDKYEIKVGDFGSVEVTIKDINHTYYFTPYLVKIIKNNIDAFQAQ
jgi:hypothetical protein